MAFQNEKEIGLEAERKLTDALQQKVSSLSFKDHYGNNKSLVTDTIGSADIKTSQNTLGETVFYLNRLYLRMPHHGFIQHYGANTIRRAGNRTRKKPKSTTYGYAAHYYNLQDRDFIGKAIEQSGVLDFVMQEVTQIRTDGVTAGLIRFLESNI